MNVTLSPVMPRTVAVGSADDPYKRYWWAILAGFGLTGMWLCLPMMETSVGSVRVDAGKLAEGGLAEQSLDAAAGPDGSPGDALDLSMGGTSGGRKLDGAVASMLYQAPEDSQASLGAPSGSASGASGTLAQSLKDVGDKKDASWGGEKAQRGFSSPRLAGGSLSGLGGSAGSSSASAGSGMGAFGSRDAQVGYSSTRGLRDGEGAGQAKSGGIAALKQAAQVSANAASQSSGDAASSGLSRAFDGSKAQNAIGAGGKKGADAGLYSSLDAAPVNLKANDPKLDKKEFKAPPTTDARDDAEKDEDLMKQLAMVAVTAAIGGLIPGVGGQVAAAMMGVMMKNNEAKNQKSAERAQKRAWMTAQLRCRRPYGADARYQA